MKSSVPGLHLLMIVVAAVLAVAGMAGHLLAPADSLFEYVVVACIGFLFGKATNGFGKRE